MLDPGILVLLLRLGVSWQCGLGLLLLNGPHTFPSNTTLLKGFVTVRNTRGQWGFSYVGTKQRKTLIPVIKTQGKRELIIEV